MGMVHSIFFSFNLSSLIMTEIYSPPCLEKAISAYSVPGQAELDRLGSAPCSDAKMGPSPRLVVCIEVYSWGTRYLFSPCYYQHCGIVMKIYLALAVAAVSVAQELYITTNGTSQRSCPTPTASPHFYFDSTTYVVNETVRYVMLRLIRRLDLSWH